MTDLDIINDVNTIVEANIQLKDVQQVHANFPTTGTRSYYKCSDTPTMTEAIPWSHFKGMSFFKDKMIMTHTDILFDLPYVTTGKYLIADKTSGNQGTVQRTLKISPEGYQHPCSSQACGSFMAMGVQEGVSSSSSQIQILDIRKVLENQPAVILGSIPRPKDGVNGVAMTKEAGTNGKYIVAAVNGGNLSLYRSESATLITNGAPTVSFTEIMSTTSFPDSGAGLALVTQKDGAIFMFALNADNEGQNNQLNLYKLNLQGTPSYTLVATKNMDIPGMSESIDLLFDYSVVKPEAAIIAAAIGKKTLNTSFRWGKGLAITSEETIEVYASDRNTWALSDIPLIGSDKDFGIVKWKNNPPAKNVLPLNTPLNVGQTLLSNNRQFFAVMQADGNLCVYKGTPEKQGPYVWGTQATAGGGVFYTIVQSDGNLCTYRGTTSSQGPYLWGTQALGSGGKFFLIMQDDGNLCVYKGTGTIDQGDFIWGSNPTPVKNFLPLNTPLNVGQALLSNNRQFFAVMQGDGNFCVYKGTPEKQGQYVWGTRATAGGGVFFTIVQADGNLCTYRGSLDKQGAYLWGTQKLGSGGHFFMVMQDDGNLCVYKGAPNEQGSFIWGSKN